MAQDRDIIDDTLRPIWEAGGQVDPAPPGDLEAALRTALQARRARESMVEGRRVAASAGRSQWSRAIASMLAAAVVVMGAVLWHWPSSRQASTKWRTVAVPNGQRMAIVLSDGTRLTVNAGSRIRYPRAFGSGARDVYLDGEAYFVVVHDAHHPFTVHVDHATVTDVGTQFDVRAYGDDGAARVAVAEGSVCIGDGHRGDVPCRQSLYAQDVAWIDSDHVTIAHNADVAQATAWLQGNLAFSDARLDGVVRELTRTFNVPVTLADSTLGRELVTGNFAHQPLDRILQTLTAIIGAQYDQQGGHVVIRRRVPGATASPARAPHPVLKTAMNGAIER